MAGCGWEKKNVLCSDWKREYIQGQSWTVVVEKINSENWNMAIMGSMVAMTSNSHLGSPGLTPPRSQIYPLLLPPNWRVKTMGEGDDEDECR